MGLENMARQAKVASMQMMTISTAIKDNALKAAAKALRDNYLKIVEANKKDMEAAEKAGTSSALLDRLMLNKQRVEEMAVSAEEIVSLKDPIGEVVGGSKLANGLKLSRVRVPLGVIGVIYEARPNVTVEAASLCVKAGNAVILRGGSSANHSNKILVELISNACISAGLPQGVVQMIEDTSHQTADKFMQLDKYLDVLVPRGGNELIKAVVEKATVPVLWAAAGNCHTYVDKDANQDMAIDIAINAKCQRPGVCNAMETLLVHKDIANDFLPKATSEMKANGVKMYGDKKAQAIVSDLSKATEKDYYTEYLSLELAIRVVDSLDEAIAHINKYGTGHSEAIITDDYSSAQTFTEGVDAAAVYVNASTRFTDGGQFGMGAEIGISTQKLHVRGPMGLEALTSTKYVIYGSGQTRQ
ncbi:MAG: glutamate-5-semialdehyde dehydrogenase [Actinobacteria bacterium]|nr:MAG: glutamate-5-semialdehyde dehydrogenase [Actinomycetota bacterium]